MSGSLEASGRFLEDMKLSSIPWEFKDYTKIGLTISDWEFRKVLDFGRSKYSLWMSVDF